MGGCVKNFRSVSFFVCSGDVTQTHTYINTYTHTYTSEFQNIFPGCSPPVDFENTKIKHPCLLGFKQIESETVIILKYLQLKCFEIAIEKLRRYCLFLVCLMCLGTSLWIVNFQN